MKMAWLVGLAALGASAAAGPAITPRTVRLSIRTHGARRTIHHLARTGQWEIVTDAMDAGRTEWIALAPLLAGGSDAGSAEDLGISLAFALPLNPRAVLAALDLRTGSVIGTARVCGRPFIEDTEPRGYTASALAALSRVRSPGLLARKRACVRALNAASD